jgi:hypothetical protein
MRPEFTACLGRFVCTAKWRCSVPDRVPHHGCDCRGSVGQGLLIRFMKTLPAQQCSADARVGPRLVNALMCGPVRFLNRGRAPGRTLRRLLSCDDTCSPVAALQN